MPSSDENPTIPPASPSRADLEKVTVAELRRRYPLEANSHRSVVDRCKWGKGELDPQFRRFRDFLFHILLRTGQCPGEGYTLDRRDPHDPRYAPGMVRWADHRDQQNNRTNTRRLRVPGSDEKLPLAVLARQHGIKPNTLRNRLKRNWSVERALGLGDKATSPDDATSTLNHGTAADGNPWPSGAKPEIFQPAYAAWKREVPAVLHEYATRAVFCEALCRDRIAYWDGRLDREWPEKPYFDEEVQEYNQSESARRLARWNANLATTLPLIPNTIAMKEFRQEVASNTDWLVNPKVHLGWLPMSSAVTIHKERRTRRSPAVSHTEND